MIKKILNWFGKVETANVEPFYKAREVWSYTHTDPITKRVSVRPVLVFRKASDGMFWGLPLTKTKLHGKILYVPRLNNGRKVSALSQMRTLKASRLVRKLGVAGEREFSALNSSIVRLLAESMPVPMVKAKKPRVYVRPHYNQPLLSPFASTYTLRTRVV